MLNEIAEFEEYTLDFRLFNDSEVPGRLGQRGLIKEDFSGLYRAMFIVARGFLFHSELKDLSLKEKIDRMTLILKVWLGLEASDDDRLKQIQNWFPDYLKSICFSGLNKQESREEYDLIEAELSTNPTVSGQYAAELEKQYKASEESKFRASWQTMSDSVLQKISEDQNMSYGAKEYGYFLKTKGILERVTRFKSVYYTNDLFYSKPSKSDKSQTGTPNMITYRDVIADALNAGPLQRYYLVCDEGIFDSIYLAKNPDMSLGELLQAKPKMHAKKADYLLKYAAAFVLYHVADPSMSLAIFKSVDLINWSNLTKHGEHYHYIAPDGTQYELLKSGTGAEVNDQQKGICAQWLDHYHVRVVGEKVFNEDMAKNKICLMDMGSNRALVPGIYKPLPKDWLNS